MKSRLISLWILWFVSTVIGWAVLQYPGFIERNTTIESWSMVAKLALDFGLTRGITGLVVGLCQSLTLHFLINEGKRWLLSTSIGYALGCPLGFVMAVILDLALAKIKHVSLLGEDSNTFLAMPLITTMLFSGFIVATIQQLFLRPLAWGRDMSGIALWVLGTALGWGMAGWAANIVWGTHVPPIFQDIASGATIGATTGMVMLLLLLELHSISSDKSIQNL